MLGSSASLRAPAVLLPQEADHTGAWSAHLRMHACMHAWTSCRVRGTRGMHGVGAARMRRSRVTLVRLRDAFGVEVPCNDVALGGPGCAIQQGV
eukprot:355731-Chlamydomonas_euryale.AAC.4